MLPIFRTEVFVADFNAQIHSYLETTELDEIFAAELAQRFAVAVEETLELLAALRGLGVHERRVFLTCPDTAGSTF